jgi:Na+-transporting methylmalonyl-CoA/oxaloacetate decarboxylase gamma subunit
MIHSIAQLIGIAALGAGLYLVFGVGIALIVLGTLVFVGSIAIEAYANRVPEPKDGD